jgi:hypothetical protein
MLKVDMNKLFFLFLFLIGVFGFTACTVHPAVLDGLNPTETLGSDLQRPTATAVLVKQLIPKNTTSLILPTDLPAPTTEPFEFPKIDRRPVQGTWPIEKIESLPSYNPQLNSGWQVDLRSNDLSHLDIKDREADLLYANFDSHTIWPPPEMLPKEFDWETILEYGKNPGLGIRQLHAEGITGKGVGIAIIDQTLLVDHQEFTEQLQFYEELDDIQGGWLVSQLHGSAVASIAVGKTVGVAPEADLYYIATGSCHNSSSESMDFTCMAEAIRRILEINQYLPEENKIRVISLAIGWRWGNIGYDEISAAANDAKSAGLLLICSSVEELHGFKFQGLGRSPLSDPDNDALYHPGLFWAQNIYSGYRFTNRLLVPMDSRTVASPTGTNDYVFIRTGGWSWSIPYLAGMYALAAQVKPDITPEEFWSTAMETGKTIELQHDEEQIPFGPILNPIGLVTALKE